MKIAVSHAHSQGLRAQTRQGYKVSTDTITNWENNHAKPMVYQAPAVIEFLGYNPYSFGISRLGDKVKSYRYLHGLSHKKLGKLIGVDASTVRSWECEKSYTSQKITQMLKRLKVAF